MADNLHTFFWRWSMKIFMDVDQKRLSCLAGRQKGQQVLHQRWIWGIHYTQAMKHTKEDPTWLWNPGQTSLEVHNRVSVATKDWCPQNIFRKKRFPDIQGNCDIWLTQVIESDVGIVFIVIGVNCIHHTAAVVDPGFPRSGGATLRGERPTYNFAKFSQNCVK